MPAQTKREPFTQQDLTNINRVLYDLNQLNELFDKYDACGVECAEGRMRRDDLYAQLLKIKTVFFPGKA
jgi:hypothetical protein